jgi:hypothetical protein
VRSLLGSVFGYDIADWCSHGGATDSGTDRHPSTDTDHPPASTQEPTASNSQSFIIYPFTLEIASQTVSEAVQTQVFYFFESVVLLSALVVLKVIAVTMRACAACKKSNFTPL